VKKMRKGSPAWATRAEIGGAAEGFEGEVGNDAEPGGDGGECGVEAGGGELRGEGLLFKVDRDEVCGGRDCDGSGGEADVLPGLRGGVIDLEDADVGERVAVGEGVETSAEDEVLLCAEGGDAVGKDVFGEAGAGDHEGS